MSLTLSQLKLSGYPINLEIRSLQGDIYLLDAYIPEIDSEPTNICESNGLPLKARSIIEMKEKIKGLKISSAILIYDSSYDEMIGSTSISTDDVDFNEKIIINENSKTLGVQSYQSLSW